MPYQLEMSLSVVGSGGDHTTERTIFRLVIPTTSPETIALGPIYESLIRFASLWPKDSLPGKPVEAPGLSTPGEATLER